jgi:hypothetical protein
MARARSLAEFQKSFSDQAALAGWFCVSWLRQASRGWAEKPTAFA